MNNARNTTFGVLCEKCGHRTPQTVAWLTVHNNMACGSCGVVVNLEGGQIAATIVKLAEQCAELDRLASKRD
jgi:hypothetical protein